MFLQGLGDVVLHRFILLLARTVTASVFTTEAVHARTLFLGNGRTDVGREDDNGVFKANRPALTVRKTSVVKDLK